MPFCTQCGSQVAGNAAFCANCGSRQEPGKTSSPSGNLLATMPPRTASILCYIPIFGWLACLVVLASERFRTETEVRFNAFQGLYLFVAWLIFDGHWGIGRLFHSGFRFDFGDIFKLLIFCAWIFMIVKTSQNERYSLPLIGEWAERSLSKR